MMPFPPAQWEDERGGETESPIVRTVAMTLSVSLRTAQDSEMSSSPIARLRELRIKALSLLEGLHPVALLLGRLAVGLLFLSTGWGKVHSIPKVTAFFESLHIPAPSFHAYLVGYSELFCGAALVVGLLTRLATVPLIVSMIVAILTAKLPNVHGLFDLVEADEFTYLIVLVMIAILGPGRFAIDHVLAQKIQAGDAKRA
jgi:putative oxidoreductase